MLLAEFNLLTPGGMAALLAMLACFLMVAEVLLPSGGILGFLSVCAMLGSVYYAYRSAGLTGGLTMSLVLVVVIPLLLVGAFRVLPYTPLGRQILGQAPTEADVSPDDRRKVLLGKVGVVRSKMLPSGTVEIDGQMIDAVSRGQALEPGQYAKVVEVRGNRVVVVPASQGDPPAAPSPDDLLARPIDELGLESMDDPLA